MRAGLSVGPANQATWTTNREPKSMAGSLNPGPRSNSAEFGGPMKRVKDRPDSAIVVTSYQQLDRFVRAFADGKLNLLIIAGSPGLQKSSAVRRAVCEGAFWIEGNATPFKMYCDLY